MNGENELPEGWIEVKLPDIVQINMGQSPPGSTYNQKGEGLPFFQGKIDFTDRHPKIRVFCTEPRKIANTGDILLSVRAPVGPTNIANCTCAIGRGLTALSPFGGIPTEFVLNYLRFKESELDASGTGSTFTAISKSVLEEFVIPLPPLAEQRRIVAAVEALLDRVNASRERLDRVPRLLKAFRQAVLAAACSGRLTDGWREEHPEIENVTEELIILLKSRKINSKNRSKYTFELKEPVIHEIFKGVLPETWTITTVGFLGHVTKLAGFEYTKYFKLEDTGDIPVIRAQNVQMGKFIPENLKYISQSVSDNLGRSQVHGNEILIVYVGAGVGNVCLAPSDGKWHLSSNVGKITPDWIDRKYFLYYLQSKQGLQGVLTRSKATAQPSLSMDSIRQVLVAVPPSLEQHEIVRRVESLFALADRIEQRVATGRERADRLTQAILAKAFRGMLVPTEAELARMEEREYEPASMLLERIRRERESLGEMKPRKRGIRSTKGVQ